MSTEGTSEANVRYVMAGTPVGWAAMAKTLRNVDGDKIRDCKEDIDTLLVFAGLFSAVVTAFLAESYKSLEADDRKTTVELLRQLVAQTHTYQTTPGSIISNTTLPPSLLDPPSDFEPELALVRVNALWFAALVLSLTTASFGILVKQWMREYLAGEYTSGQARLRVRQFRYPGLADWRVFDVAAVLPLVLQVALGVFLLGLCLFTAHVHTAVGWTTTPLVVIWATLFLSSIVAPVLSPRCPFKIALLKRALKALRRLLWSIPPVGEILTTLQRRHYLPKPGNTFASETSTMGLTAQKRLPYEEEDAAKDERHDLAILASVDSILQDDDLLGTTMLESLQQGQIEPNEVVDFTFSAMQRRLPYQYNIRVAATPPSSLLDLRKLRKQGWEAVVNILADTVAKGFSEPSRPSCYPPWTANAILIMLSRHPCPITPQGNRALSLCFTGPEARECTAQVLAFRTAPTTPGNLTHVLRRLRPVFALLAPGDVVFGLLAVLHQCVCRDHQHGDDQLVEFFRVHEEKTMLPGVTKAVLGVLVDCVNREASGDDAASWSQWTGHALRALLSCDVPPDAKRDVGRLVCTLSRRSNESYVTLLNVIAVNKKGRAAEEPALTTFRDMFEDAEIAERRSILTNLAAINNEYIRNELDQEDSAMINPVRLCRLGAWLLQGQGHSDELREEWRTFWTLIASAIKKFVTCEFDVVEQRLLAQECLALLEELDTHPGRHYDPGWSYSSWLKGFRPDESRFPEDLFVELDVLVPGRVGLEYRRIRRLRDERHRDVEEPQQDPRVA